MIDLVVVGGGMAGLTAAARVALGGGSVVVIERASELGGSARFAGYLWTAPSIDVLAEVDPGGVAMLRETLVAGYDDAVAWAESLEVALSDEVAVLRFGRGRRIDTAAYVRACEQVIRRAGGEIVVDGDVTNLVVDGGVVRGVDVVAFQGGPTRRVDARWTLLATGGFQGDSQLTSELIGANAALMPLRSNPTSAGGGLRLGRQAGAAFGTECAGFYGHLVLADVPLDDPTQFANQTLYYSEHALVFNRDGYRFIDETVGDHLTAIAACQQPDARVLVVADQRVRDEWMLGSYVEGIVPVDRLEICRRRGGRYAVAESLDDFDYLPSEWGYSGSVIRSEIEHFNDAAASGAALSPARRFDPAPLDKAPYYVLEASAAITFTFGGVLIDDRARALDERGRAIPGLMAAGADAGGLFHQAYAGGLAAACVFGMVSADTVLASI